MTSRVAGILSLLSRRSLELLSDPELRERESEILSGCGELSNEGGYGLRGDATIPSSVEVLLCRDVLLDLLFLVNHLPTLDLRFSFLFPGAGSPCAPNSASARLMEMELLSAPRPPLPSPSPLLLSELVNKELLRGWTRTRAGRLKLLCRPSYLGGQKNTV